MKKLFMAVLLCVGFSIYAQEATETKKKANKEAKSPEKMVEARLSKMTTELSLNEKQQEQIKPILVEQTAKMEEIKAKQKANKEAGVELSDADKKAMRMKMKDEKEATDVKIKSILTPEQFAKYQEIQKEQREKMMSQKKPKGDQ
jgi:protein CpxP